MTKVYADVNADANKAWYLVHVIEKYQGKNNIAYKNALRKAKTLDALSDA